MTSTTLPRSETAAGIGYVDRGAGEAVVLVHGVGMNADVWAPQIDALAATRRVIAMDMPGHGMSVPPPADAGLMDFVAALDGLLNTLGIERANLVGHSMGALVVLGYALRHPGRVLRVAALNAVYCRDGAARLAVRERARQIADSGATVDVEAPLRRWFGPTPNRDELNAMTSVRHWLAQVDAGGYAVAYRVFATSDSAHAGHLQTLDCPALFLTGELDPNSTPAMSQRMAAEAPHGKAVVVPGQRHMVSLVAPDIVNAALADWLAEPVAPALGAQR